MSTEENNTSGSSKPASDTGKKEGSSGESSSGEKKLSPEAEHWKKVAEKMNFWSTFVEVRLLGIGSLMEQLNAETVLAANAAKEAARDAELSAKILARVVGFPEVKARLKAKLEKAKEDVEETEEHMSAVATGLVVLGVLAAATVSTVLEKEL